MHEERNKDICEAHVNGLTIAECSVKFGLTRERVRQILRKAGMLNDSRSKPPAMGLNQGVVESGARDEFLGVLMSDAEKAGLREEAMRRGLSMSRLSSDFIREALARLREERQV